MNNAILLTDGYKLDHRRQYPIGTEYVYSNWTPRSNVYFKEAQDGCVVFGIQYFIKKYLIELFNEKFFNLNEDKLKEKSEYCEKLGFKPDYINENPEVLNTRKPYYNLLLDDRSNLSETYKLLCDIISYKRCKDANNRLYK